jgi:Flp pilus assembly protein TadG
MMSRSDAGAALVEMVIVTPVFLLLLFGLIQAGRAVDFALKVGSAAHAGVQYGAQNHATAADLTGMQTAATNDAATSGVSATASNYCQCADGTASVCGQAGACSANHQNLYVEVIVTGSMPSPLNSSFLPTSLKTITVTRSAIMRVLQ